MLLIPSLDLLDGHCVRLLQGDFAASTRYEQEPQKLLRHYQELGASWLHVVDLDGARAGHSHNLPVIQQLAAQGGLQLQVGGGVRAAPAIEALLALGVARVVIGSAAAEQPAQVAQWIDDFGAERICLAFDVRHDAQGIPRLRTRGWLRDTELSLWEAVAAFDGSGLRHVLCTDIERDGVLGGPNLALYTRCLQRYPALQWQASGGIASGEDLRALERCGVPAAISGKALLEQRIETRELQSFLRNA
jgi:phosphoribosylformimino-5-aminoimidazole carboxamide ribotide isomerase